MQAIKIDRPRVGIVFRLGRKFVAAHRFRLASMCRYSKGPPDLLLTQKAMPTINRRTARPSPRAPSFRLEQSAPESRMLQLSLVARSNRESLITFPDR